MDLVAGNASVSLNLHWLPHQIQMIEAGVIQLYFEVIERVVGLKLLPVVLLT
jgi:hypothetical protein